MIKTKLSKISALLITLLLITIAILMSACGGGEPTNQTPPPSEPGEPSSPSEQYNPLTDDEMQGLNVVLSEQELQSILLSTSSHALMSNNLNQTQYSKQQLANAINKIGENIINSSALYCDFSCKFEEDVTHTEKFIFTSTGEYWGLTREINASGTTIYEKQEWKLNDNNTWMKYEIDTSNDVIYSKKLITPDSEQLTMEYFCKDKFVMVHKTITENDIVGCTLKNGYYFIEISTTVYEGSGEELEINDKFLVENGRVNTDYQVWVGDSRTDIVMNYKYNQNVDLSHLQLPELPDGEEWVLTES